MHFFSVPNWIQKYFHRLTWSKYNPEERTIYVTFDDGPIPEVTPVVLQILAEKNVPATFFCVGDNIRKHPDIFKLLVNQGHSYANHTYNHLKGWNVSSEQYLQNIEQFEQELSNQGYERSRLFRPPYGRIKPSVVSTLLKNYEIIMWDVLTCDYDRNLDPERCLQEAIRRTRPGSIVLFHDSIKSERNVLHVLPKYIEHFKEKGYQFKKL